MDDLLRLGLMVLFFVFPAVAVALNLVATASIKGFLRDTPRLADRDQLESFRAVIEKNSRLARGTTITFLLSVAAFALGVFLGVFESSEMWRAGLPYAVMLPLGILGGRFEKRMRSLEATSKELQEGRDQIVKAW